MVKIGDIVIYRVHEGDEAAIRYNHAEELPAIVTMVWSEECVNLRVFCDGPIDAWKTSVMRGDVPGKWYVPEG